MLYIDEYKNLDKYKYLICKATSLEEMKNIYSEYLKIDKDYYSDMESIILKSFISNIHFIKKIDDDIFIKCMYSYDKNTLLSMTDDFAQINIINKFKETINKQTSIKNCPHCGLVFNNIRGNQYIICGYTGNHKGYDWKGCKRDWCFTCGKKLCKVWDFDELYDEDNRFHDTCCIKYAKMNKLSKDDFCSCKSTKKNIT